MFWDRARTPWGEHANSMQKGPCGDNKTCSFQNMTIFLFYSQLRSQRKVAEMITEWFLAVVANS